MNGYERSKQHDEEQARKREMFYAMMDYSEGKDTPGARMVAETLAKIQERKRASRLSGDPLRLLPEHRKVKIAEQKEAEKARRERRKKGDAPETPEEALETETVPHPENPWIGSSQVRRRGYGLRYLEEYQQHAIGRFERDWELAYGSDLKGAAWTPKVDGGGGASRAHVIRLDAQSRLARLQAALYDTEKKDSDYRLLVAVVIHGVTMRDIQAKGGPKKAVATDAMKGVARKVAAFYGDARNVKNSLIDALDKIEAQIKEAARGVDRTITASGVSGEEMRRRQR